VVKLTFLWQKWFFGQTFSPLDKSNVIFGVCLSKNCLFLIKQRFVFGILKRVLLLSKSAYEMGLSTLDDLVPINAHDHAVYCYAGEPGEAG
jgi:hypothetical protein